MKSIDADHMGIKGGQGRDGYDIARDVFYLVFIVVLGCAVVAAAWAYVTGGPNA